MIGNVAPRMGNARWLRLAEERARRPMTAWAARGERNGTAFSNFALLFSLAADIQWIRLPIGKVIYGWVAYSNCRERPAILVLCETVNVFGLHYGRYVLSWL
jgi:hypothetical protein